MPSEAQIKSWRRIHRVIAFGIIFWLFVLARFGLPFDGIDVEPGPAAGAWFGLCLLGLLVFTMAIAHSLWYGIFAWSIASGFLIERAVAHFPIIAAHWITAIVFGFVVGRGIAWLREWQQNDGIWSPQDIRDHRHWWQGAAAGGATYALLVAVIALV